MRYLWSIPAGVVAWFVGGFSATYLKGLPAGTTDFVPPRIDLLVLGGFAEVSSQGLTVLADVATAVEDIDHAAIAAHIKQTEEKVAKMEQGSLLDREISRLDHFKSLQMQLTATAMH